MRTAGQATHIVVADVSLSSFDEQAYVEMKERISRVEI
jgi:hypothetical protein